MKSFFWKFIICLVPCLLAAWATTDATIKYYNGDSGGFKLGVDLVGGTILVYEIDLRKNTGPKKGQQTFDPVRDINVLAEVAQAPHRSERSLQHHHPPRRRRRPHRDHPPHRRHVRTKKAKLSGRSPQRSEGPIRPDYKGELEVGRGKVLELADKYNRSSPRNSGRRSSQQPDGWERFKKSALQYWAKIELEIKATRTPTRSWRRNSTPSRSATSTASPTSCSTPLPRPRRPPPRDRPELDQEASLGRDHDPGAPRVVPVKAWDEATDYPSGGFAMVGTLMYRAEKSKQESEAG